MAATFEWDEANGAGETISHNVTMAYKKIDTAGAANYDTNHIPAGSHSFEKYQFGHITGGTWNSLTNGLWAHTAQATDSPSVKLYGSPAASTAMRTYAQPVDTVSTQATVDMSGVTAIGSGYAVYFGPTNANPTGKVATYNNPGAGTAWTNYLVSQLQTTGAAQSQDIPTVTWTLRYDET